MRLSSFAIWFCGIFFRVNPVFMNPGDIELTLIPVGPSSTASVFAAPSQVRVLKGYREVVLRDQAVQKETKLQ